MALRFALLKLMLFLQGLLTPKKNLDGTSQTGSAINLIDGDKRMDAHRLIYGTRAHNEFWDWLDCGYYVQMHMYWAWGVKSCPDWNQVEGLK